MPVSPTRAQVSTAAFSHSARCAGVGVGSTTRSIALSMSTPVGSPFASRTMRPPVAPAGRVLRVSRDACLLEAGTVDPRGVAVDAREVDRCRWKRGVERRARGELRLGPLVLIPPAAHAPLSARSLGAGRLHALDR